MLTTKMYVDDPTWRWFVLTPYKAAFILLCLVLAVLDVTVASSTDDTGSGPSYYWSRHLPGQYSHRSSHIGPLPHLNTVVTEWTQWGRWGKCSRPCNTGVRSRARHCISSTLRVMPGSGIRTSHDQCTGPSTQYDACNTRQCISQKSGGGKGTTLVPPSSEELLSFRAAQCRQYNNRRVFGKIVNRWLPYTQGHSNPCSLVCEGEGEGIVYTFGKVRDGTHCTVKQGTMGLCVDGRCLRISCDGELGGSAQEDQCRVCGGSNTTCTLHKGVFHSPAPTVPSPSHHPKLATTSTLPSPRAEHSTASGGGFTELANASSTAATTVQWHQMADQPAHRSNSRIYTGGTLGYYEVTSIPKGSTNVKISDNSHNFLALREGAKFLLNGDWLIDWPGDIEAGGAVFSYARAENDSETLSSLGPTKTELYLMILLREGNPGVYYEYWTPNSFMPSFKPHHSKHSHTHSSHHHKRDRAPKVPLIAPFNSSYFPLPQQSIGSPFYASSSMYSPTTYTTKAPSALLISKYLNDLEHTPRHAEDEIRLGSAGASNRDFWDNESGHKRHQRQYLVQQTPSYKRNNRGSLSQPTNTPTSPIFDDGQLNPQKHFHNWDDRSNLINSKKSSNSNLYNKNKNLLLTGISESNEEKDFIYRTHSPSDGKENYSRHIEKAVLKNLESQNPKHDRKIAPFPSTNSSIYSPARTDSSSATTTVERDLEGDYQQLKEFGGRRSNTGRSRSNSRLSSNNISSVGRNTLRQPTHQHDQLEVDPPNSQRGNKISLSSESMKQGKQEGDRRWKNHSKKPRDDQKWQLRSGLQMEATARKPPKNHQHYHHLFHGAKKGDELVPSSSDGRDREQQVFLQQAIGYDQREQSTAATVLPETPARKRITKKMSFRKRKTRRKKRRKKRKKKRRDDGKIIEGSGSCPRCYRVKEVRKHFCTSDFVSRVEVLSLETHVGGGGAGQRPPPAQQISQQLLGDLELQKEANTKKDDGAELLSKNKGVVRDKGWTGTGEDAGKKELKEDLTEENEGDEGRYEVIIHHSFKNRVPLLHKEFFWVPRENNRSTSTVRDGGQASSKVDCLCPRLKVGQMYLVMGRTEMSKSGREMRLTLNSNSYVRRFNERVYERIINIRNNEMDHCNKYRRKLNQQISSFSTVVNGSNTQLSFAEEDEDTNGTEKEMGNLAMSEDILSGNEIWFGNSSNVIYANVSQQEMFGDNTEKRVSDGATFLRLAVGGNQVEKDLKVTEKDFIKESLEGVEESYHQGAAPSRAEINNEVTLEQMNSFIRRFGGKSKLHSHKLSIINRKWQRKLDHV